MVAGDEAADRAAPRHISQRPPRSAPPRQPLCPQLAHVEHRGLDCENDPARPLRALPTAMLPPSAWRSQQSKPVVAARSARGRATALLGALQRGAPEHEQQMQELRPLRPPTTVRSLVSTQPPPLPTARPTAMRPPVRRARVVRKITPGLTGDRRAVREAGGGRRVGGARNTAAPFERCGNPGL